MADNVTLNAGSGGDVIATEDIGGVEYQKVKIADGTAASTSMMGVFSEDAATPATITGPTVMMERDDALGTLTPIEGDWVGLRSSAEGALWVQEFNSDAILADTASMDTNLATVAGAVAGTEMQVDIVTSALPSGAATAANQSTANTSLSNIDTNTAAIVAAEAAALGSGVLIQGDDGTDRKNINVDATTGDVQVDVTNTVTVDGSGVTQPVSASSLPLPSGASTAANQSTIIGHVDGIEALLTTIDADTSNLSSVLTALQTIDDSVFADDAAFTLASSSVNMAGAIRDDALTTLTAIEGDAVPLRVSSTGALHVTGGGGGTEYSEDEATPATITGTATVMERDDAIGTLTPIEGDWAAMRCSAEGALWVQDFNSDAILADTTSIDGKITACNTGAVVISSGTVTADLGANNDVQGAAAEGAAVSGNPFLIAGDDGTNVKHVAVAADGAVHIDDGGNSITVDGTVTANAGTGTFTVDLGANNDVVVSTNTTGGQSFYLNQDTSAVASVKGSAGTLYSIACFNTHTAAVYLNLYNVASGSVTLGTTTPSMQFVVPSSGTATGGGFTINFGPQGVAFGTAITVACATTYNGSTDPGANLVITNITYA